ncbi:hypothetical protein LTS08_005582 [Lithohypha guttulata]|nr:hypothetical protein LTS08_005582 [Lithohypha guttulata]
MANIGKSENPCVLLHGPESACLGTIPVPKLSDYPADHVLLQTAYTGVCGSDVHFHLHGGIGSDNRKYAQYYVLQPGIGKDSSNGLVMGHEATATVYQIGPAVRSLIVGDNVAIEPGIPCRTCIRCAEGMYNLCFDMRFAASFYEDAEITTTVTNNNGQATKVPFIRSTPGTLSEYYVLPESLCYKLPEHISLKEGVLIEPLAVAVHAVRLAGINPMTKSVLVTGAGTIGLAVAAIASSYGANKLILVDIDDKKLSLAKEWLLGSGHENGQMSGTAINTATTVHTINSSHIGNSPAETATTIKQDENINTGTGADAAIEATGSPLATRLCIHALRPGGHMVQTGLSKTAAMDGFPITDLSEKEIHLHGAFRYKSGDFETARDLLARGVIRNVERLINKVWEFEEFEEAWKATRDGNVGGQGVKNLIKCPGLREESA